VRLVCVCTWKVKGLVDVCCHGLHTDVCVGVEGAGEGGGGGDAVGGCLIVTAVVATGVPLLQSCLNLFQMGDGVVAGYGVFEGLVSLCAYVAA
jgi:hypothetical protein